MINMPRGSTYLKFIFNFLPNPHEAPCGSPWFKFSPDPKSAAFQIPASRKSIRISHQNGLFSFSSPANGDILPLPMRKAMHAVFISVPAKITVSQDAPLREYEVEC
jgi:hypothetical protein